MKESIDNTYNRYIDLLKQSEPVLENPSELTQGILQKVKSQKTVPQSIFKRSLHVLRPVLSTAAIFLLALFLYQSYSESEKPSKVLITISKRTVTDQKTIVAGTYPFIKDSLKQKVFDCFNDTLNINCIKEAVTYYNLNKENARQTFQNKLTNFLNKDNYEIN